MFTICALALLLTPLSALAAPWGLDLQPNVTVSGISAGGFAAVQYAVAFSSSVKGLAVWAGGPYYCAQNSLITATTECMTSGLLTPVSTLIGDAQSFASSGKIDALTNLASLRVYLYSGQRDTTVATQVVQDTEAQLKQLGVPVSQFTTEYSIDAGHGVPTLDYGVACSETASPYLNNCNYDGVGAAFATMYGASALQPRTTSPPPNSNWKTLSTYDFLPSGWTDFGASLGWTAHVYVPTACQSGASCRLHIALHGCSQGEGFLGDVFYKNAGYWQWAETNKIVVLFPQAASNPLKSNPIGCFDWWGYCSSDYAFKSGVQMTTIHNMAKHLGAH